MKWPLNSPADSTGTPTGSSSPQQSLDQASQQQQAPQSNEPEGNGSDDWAETVGVSDGNADSGDDSSQDGQNDQQQPDKQQSPAPDKTQSPAEPSPDQNRQTPSQPKPDQQQQQQQQQAPDSQQQQVQSQPQQQQQETAEQKAERERLAAEAQQKIQSELEEYYKLPDDLAARLPTEPETVLPVLAAKMHQAVTQAAQQMMHQMLPQMIHQYNTVTRVNQESKQAFYERWPSLKQHEKHVLDAGKMFRQMNPKATPEDSIERIGQLVCAALGIQPDPKKDQQQVQQRTPQRPMQQRQHFRPAATGGSQAGATPPADNPFSQLAEEMVEDDQAES